MPKEIIKPALITSVSDLSPKRVVPRLAYQMEESGTGGYFLYRLTLDNMNKVVSREKVSDPDAWDYIILALEAELGKQFQ